ncbi:putative omega-hydroxypalmitate O-feruloyl transferase-like [Capsicum annuum]|nr:putative omega-hydroxypalmitate O-feruloyl transferase-like [Capsicum annuum]
MPSIGTTTMDSFGNLFQALSIPIQFVGKTIIAEALAIRIALEKAQENGWTKVQILLDAKNLVDMKKTVASWEIDTMCEYIWKLMRMFEEVSIIYIPRSWNMVAHNIEKFSLTLLDKIVWTPYFPSWVVKDASASFNSVSSALH